MSEVRLVNLVKKFGSTIAINSVSLEVKSGDFVVLLGPSGCGKTSTLRCIAGLEKPDAGDIFIGNKRANDLEPKDRDIAMVFQSYALYPHMTVFDNIGFPLKMKKASKSETKLRVREVAKMLNVEHLLSRRPRELSGGEQQRVALARSMVRQPKVFLMDEPLSNLDAKLRLYTRAEIKRLHQELKITTIYVTHDQAEAMSMADKIAVMYQGRVVQYDQPESIYGRPSNTFAAGFIGSPPMNLLKVSIMDGVQELILDAGSFKYRLPRPISDLLKNRPFGNEVIVGIRPEDIKLAPTKSEDSVFQAEVYVVEPLGQNTVVDLKVGENILKASVQGKFRNYGEKNIWVGFPPEAIRIYDAKTENLLV